jgi:enoyl-CoA hydratase/carnithine racemase
MAVHYERSGAAAIVTIDRPDRRNAIDGDTAAALLDRFHTFSDDEDAKVMILTGAEDEAFCAGADLKAIETLVPSARGGPLGFTRLLSPKPTIAAVSGYAVAGGLELALWCDLRVATESAAFGCAERRWGVPLIDGGTQRLPRIVGLGRALDMILTGRMVDAQEALAMGLVTQVVPAGGHLDAALALAELLAGFPQETMNVDRRAALQGIGLSLEEGLQLEYRLGTDVLGKGVAGAERFAQGAGRGGAPA